MALKTHKTLPFLIKFVNRNYLGSMAQRALKIGRITEIQKRHASQHYVFDAFSFKLDFSDIGLFSTISLLVYHGTYFD